VLVASDIRIQAQIPPYFDFSQLISSLGNYTYNLRSNPGPRMAVLKEILVIGGTGAQGMPVVKGKT
jgi:hypothetical protein